ncbi:MAG: ATP-binding cassette domain-containing protein [Acidiferrobacterales bacterium]|nr:ATP-binding cassette domain-containing protein [Acidiferrobacterales bacterium]
MNDSTPGGYTSLAELAARSGTSVPCAANLPVDLDDPDHIWYIDRGAVNLFIIEYIEGVMQAPQHLLSSESGRLLPGVAPDRRDDKTGTTLHLVAKGTPDSLLKRLPVSLLSEVDPAETAEQIDTWLTQITATLSRFVNPLPRMTAYAKPDQMQSVAPGTLSALGGVVWVTELPQSGCLFMDIIEQAELSRMDSSLQTILPMTPYSWLNLNAETTVSGKSTETLAREGTLMPALAYFHTVAFDLERLNRRLAVVDEVNLEVALSSSRRMVEKVARHRLFNLYELPVDQDVSAGDTGLVDALKTIGHREGINFTIPSRSALGTTPLRLFDVLTASGIRARRVRLNSDEKWWRSDSNALLAFRSENDQPVALLPGTFGGYREYDPVTKRKTRVTSDSAGTLAEDAWVFYQPLPTGKMNLADMLKIGLSGSLADLTWLVIVGTLFGLIKLVPALALGYVATEVTSDGTLDELWIFAAMIAGFGVAGALLHILQSTTMMRIEGRTASRIEAAYWDRLMRLPSKILHQYPVGNLAMSGMTFQNLRDGFQGVVSDSLLSVIFLLPIFAVIFFYDTFLGVVALVFSLFSLLITVIFGLRQILPYGRMLGAARRVAGRLFQIVDGIVKLRVENAEGSAYAIWAQEYRQQKNAEIELGSLEGHLRAFAAALPFLAGGVLLFATAIQNSGHVAIGSFLIVYTAFLVLQSAISRLGESIGTIASLLPAFKQIRPMLAAVPEVESEGNPVPKLGGEILFDQVSFRYGPDGPLILDDVTIHIRPGEFVAIAGESGAGKSTLLRLALGIEQPTAGAVYFDGRDVNQLNLKQLRREIGTVPQSVALHPNDIWDNVVSHHENVTSEEIWRAARTAEIDELIKAMPMGMMTMVGASGSVLSGGESQRVTIARSVVRNPRIIMLDEATNWLDNESQARVMQNLAALTSTRVVIAHRLSELAQADQIYVMKSGKVIQKGSFQNLMAVDGVFKELVRRQTL